MLLHLLAYLTLLTFAIMRRDGGQVLVASLLLANWSLASAFIYITDCVFPWPWFLTIDWLTALTLWIDRDNAWQRALVISYAAELLLHAAFAFVTRDVDASNWSLVSAPIYWRQWWYWHSLDVVAWAQTGLLGSWIGYDMVRHWTMSRGSISPALDCDEAAS